jgi:hypothetical protein
VAGSAANVKNSPPPNSDVNQTGCTYYGSGWIYDAASDGSSDTRALVSSAESGKLVPAAFRSHSAK